MRFKVKNRGIPNKPAAIKILGIVGAVASVISIITAAMSGWLIWKFVRYMNTAQHALPTIEKASALYLKKNEKTEQNK